MEKRSLTTGEIAKYCGVNFRTVIRWIKKGHLKAFQLPGRGDNRVMVKDFLDFLKRHQMPVPEEFQETDHRVLIVEDDPSMARNIQRVLRRAGFETEVAHDGFSAGALSQTFLPAVITLDLRMPGLGGLDVIEFVRSTKTLEDTKILVVSAMPEADLQKALAAGADAVLEKPFRNEELVEKVARLAGVEIPAQSGL
ncbi:MAG: response regulator [Candidatus Latescibacterota bacterium]